MKKFLSFLLLLAMILAQVGCASQPGSSAEPIRDYRDIPGVTDEEIRLIEQLKAQGTAFVYGMVYSRESYVQKDGAPGGFSALFCEWLSELFGIPFRLQLYEWDDLIEGLDAGDIHFSGEFTPTEQRRRHYAMSATVAHRAIQRMQLRDAPSIEDIRKQRDPRYVFLRGATTYDSVSATDADPFIPLYCDTHQQALEMIRRGEADAFLIDSPASAMFLEEDVVFQDFFPLVYEPVSFTAADPRLAPVVRVLDRFIEADRESLLIELYDQGDRAYLQHAFESLLTAGEQAYINGLLQSGTAIRVIFEPDNYPVSFYNAQEEEYQGIAVDVLAEIGEISGIVFDAVESEPEWAAILGHLSRGEVDMISELIYSPDREQDFLWTESAYMQDRFALVSRADSEPATLGHIMNSRVGLIESTVYMQLFLSWFPEHKDTVLYPHSEAAFDALERGEVDLIMVTNKMLLSMTNYKERPIFEASMVFDRVYESRFGISRGNEMLAAVVDKAQRLVDTGSIADRWNRKVYDYRVKMYQMRIPYLTAFCILLGCVLVMVVVLLVRHRGMNRRLELVVQDRTKELEVQTQAAQAASKAKGEFLARMSHEIRTPLNAVIGMTQVARMSEALNDNYRGQLDEILKASTHLLDILNDVLDMSKIESGKMSLAAEPFGLFSALGEVVSIFKQRCEEKRISFHSNYLCLADVHVLGDRLHLKQILINLLGNSVKFTQEGGRVHFRVDVEQNTEEAVTITFAVDDNGIGMTKEQVSRLFGAFEQADSSISTRFGGSGLGLAISQYLVRQMGGEIKVQSEPGIGSVFTFTLTFAKADPNVVEEVQEADTDTHALDLSGKRILLAEDIQINRTILIELLRDTGVSIDEAEDGRQAVEIFEQSPPGFYHMIFMDVQMPHMNGYEATACIRSMPRADAASIPIVAMTANAYNEDIAKEQDAGMNGHISKPIDIDIVRKVLSDYFSGDTHAAPL